MAFRKSRKGKKRNLKTSVKNVIHSLAETKHSTVLSQSKYSLTNFGAEDSPGLYKGSFTQQLDLLADVSLGSGANQRIGNTINARGVRLELTYDNSASDSKAPIYITSLLVLTTEPQTIMVQLFKGLDTPSSLAYPNLIKQGDETAHSVHTIPLNTKCMRILHKSSVRLGCKGEPDMPGPRFAQRVVYVPLDKKFHFGATPLSVPSAPLQMKPTLLYICFATNPTQIKHTGAGNFIHSIRSLVYFKDL